MNLKLKISKRIWIFSLITVVLCSYSGMLNAGNQENRQQQRSVQGTVTDEEGLPLPGVNVIVKGTTRGSVTDNQGHYIIEDLPMDANVLVFSCIGMTTKEVTIDDRNVIDIVLEVDAIGLDELVFTGYMTQRKADLTGAVSMVSMDDIVSTNNSNVLTSLQGRVPGMVIQRTDGGNPAEKISIEIRGLGNVKDQGTPGQPLIVLDGLPTQINLRDINSNDIESIQVLKDASSASIYGSRAANGVILINTKRGRAGEINVKYDGHFGFSSFLRRPDMCNTEEYGRVIWQAAVNDGFDPHDMTQLFSYDWHEENGIPVLDKVTPVEWLNSAHTMKAADTDWIKEGTQLGRQNNHQLTFSGGTERFSHLFSANYLENQGIQKYTGFNRYGIRLNSEYNALNKRLIIGENFFMSKSKLNSTNRMVGLMTTPPIIPVYTVDGSEWGGGAMELGMSPFTNPVRELEMNKDNYQHGSNIIGDIYAIIKLLKNLSFRSQYGVEYTNNFYRNIDFTWTEAGGGRDDINGVNTFQSHNLNWTWTNTLNYQLAIGNHILDWLAGMEAYQYNFESLQGWRQDIEVEDYDFAILNAATGNQNATGSADEYTLLSYFSKLNYSYKNKYLLSATLRYDGCSKFGENNKFGFFPAISAGWWLSQEDFLKNSSVISLLKLRAGWGENGNSNVIPSNAAISSYGTNVQYTGVALSGNENGPLVSGYYRSSSGNVDLKWETSRQTNLGLDFGLFDNHLSGSLDVYRKITEGMLWYIQGTYVMGEGAGHWVNIGNMANNGVELVLTYSNDRTRKFHYDITGNLAANRNRINELPEEEVLKTWYTVGQTGLNIIGRNFRTVHGLVVDGIYQTQEEVDNGPEQQGKGIGRLKILDVNNDGMIDFDYDEVYQDSPDPDFTFGVNFNASYMNFDLSLFWQGIAGNIINNVGKFTSDFHGGRVRGSAGMVFPGYNHRTRILNAWSPTNTDSDIPALSFRTHGYEPSCNYYVESGSYLKLRNVELGYTLPGNLINKMKIQNMRISLSAQNLLSFHKWWGDDAFTGIDPEEGEGFLMEGRGYGFSTTFLLGVNVSF